MTFMLHSKKPTARRTENTLFLGRPDRVLLVWHVVLSISLINFSSIYGSVHTGATWHWSRLWRLPGPERSWAEAHSAAHSSRTVLSADSHWAGCWRRAGSCPRGCAAVDAAAAARPACSRRPSSRAASAGSAATCRGWPATPRDWPATCSGWAGSWTGLSGCSAPTARPGSTWTGSGTLCHPRAACAHLPCFHSYLDCHPTGCHQCCPKIPCSVYISFCAWNETTIN